MLVAKPGSAHAGTFIDLANGAVRACRTSEFPRWNEARSRGTLLTKWAVGECQPAGHHGDHDGKVLAEAYQKCPLGEFPASVTHADVAKRYAVTRANHSSRGK